MREKRDGIPAEIKNQLPRRCMNCGAGGRMNYHHIVPVAYGGKTVITNISVLCEACHSKVHYGDKGQIFNGDAVKAAIARKKENGEPWGKRRVIDYDAAMKMIAEHSTQFDGDGWTEDEIKKEIGVGDTQYCKIKRQLILEVKGDEWLHEWRKPLVVRNRPIYPRVIHKKREQGGRVI